MRRGPCENSGPDGSSFGSPDLQQERSRSFPPLPPRYGAASARRRRGNLLASFHYRLTFINLVWLNAGTHGRVLLFVPFLPSALVQERDESGPADEMMPQQVNRL